MISATSYSMNFIQVVSNFGRKTVWALVGTYIYLRYKEISCLVDYILQEIPVAAS